MQFELEDFQKFGNENEKSDLKEHLENFNQFLVNDVTILFIKKKNYYYY